MALDFLSPAGGWSRLALIVGVAVGAHVAVRLVRWLGGRLLALGAGQARLSKPRTVASLAISTAVFAIYFVAVGMVLAEFGVSVTAYLASASVIGLAVGFGSQGIVQDVVTGLTVIFSDLFDVGDLVEVSGQTGLVSHVGMRFTVLTTPLGSSVYIPNRTISNVVNYPRGYVRCLVDVTLPADDALAERIEALVREAVRSAHEQFAGIHRRPPGVEGRFETAAGRRYLRCKFRIWPGRGAPLEGAFRAELLRVIRGLDPDYADSMIAVSYEVEPPAPRGVGSRA